MNFWVRFRRNTTRHLVLSAGVLLLVMGLHGQAQASPGTDLFQEFLQHVHTQIIKDKQEFSLADTCTAWFYKQQQHTKPKAGAQTVRFMFTRPLDSNHECVKRYSDLEAAREGFGKAQQELSLSLTFFQMVLVGDGDDNREYNLQETRDVVESLGLPFFSHQPVTEYIGHLTGLFDRMRADVQFKSLMDGMQSLMNKGYRFTAADQEGLNAELK